MTARAREWQNPDLRLPSEKVTHAAAGEEEWEKQRVSDPDAHTDRRPGPDTEERWVSPSSQVGVGAPGAHLES